MTKGKIIFTGGKVLKVNYTKVKGRYLRNITLDGKHFPSKFNFGFTKNPERDFINVKKTLIIK